MWENRVLHESTPTAGSAQSSRDGRRTEEFATLREERSFTPAAPRTEFGRRGQLRVVVPPAAGHFGPIGQAPTRDDAACRGLDIAIAAAAILFVVPLLIVLCALIYFQDGGRPIFSHERIGRGGRRFRCLKLRSMALDAEARLSELLSRDAAARAEWARDHKLRADPRVTPLGRFLRTSSLDELPQLINVLRGEMAIVGPRPIVDGEVHRYGRHFRHYCAVRPGITGLWQVGGRNDVSYRRRVVMDVAYAKSKSIGVDIRIIFATVPAVLLRRGSY
jgi:exopolysaccharide production protein ExoY